MEYAIVQSPLRASYRRSDALSEGRRLYSILLKTLYVNESIIIDDLEVGIGVHSIELSGTSNISILGEGRLAVL